MTHPAELPTERLLESCQVRRQKRSGPGGQHRNKVETAVVISHPPSGCSGEASERRSQEQNRREAVGRLRVNLALQVRSRRDQFPSPRWLARCRGGRIAVSPRHEDFPALLAEALDCLDQCQWDAAAAAERLRCTTSQLVKLLKADHRGLEQLNEQRSGRGLAPLK